MMIKKKLGLLAASVMVASGAQAAMQSGGGNDSSVILALTDFSGAGGSYLIDLTQQAGVTQDQLQGGNGFVYGLSASAQAFVAGSTDLRWAMFAISGQEGPYVGYTTTASGGYNYFYDNVDPDFGIVYTSDNTPLGVGANVTLRNQAVALNDWINAMNLAGIGGTGEIAVANGAPADGDTPARETAVGGLFSTGLAQLFYEQTQAIPNNAAGATDPTLVNAITITGPSGAFQGADLLPGAFAVTSLGGPVVPVPAAAWLFGSALLGLGVVRRRK